MKRRDLIKGLAASAALPALGLGRGARAQAPEQPQPNVILVAFDTLRADRLGCYGYHRDTSPNLDRFAADAVLFERCISQSNETLTSFASLLQSVWPSEVAHLSYEKYRLPADALTLAEILRIHGYQTAGFVAGGHLVKAFGNDRGFDTFRDEWHFGSFHHTVPPALEWLDQRDSSRPFHLFVHGYDVHSPYAPPLWFQDLFDPEYRGLMDDLLVNDQLLEIEKVWNGRYYPALSRRAMTRMLPENNMLVLHTDLFSLLALQNPDDGVPVSREDEQHVGNHYDGAIVYADLLFGRFLDQLERRGLLDNSIVVVIGDHGEDLYEHGHANHRISLHDASTHVPLLVRFPGGAHGGTRVRHLVGLCDMLPTILDSASIVAPAQARGRSLMPLLTGGDTSQLEELVLSEGIMPMGSVRSPDHRLVLAGVLPGSEEYLRVVRDVDISHEGLSLYRVAPGFERKLDMESAESKRMAESMLDGMRRLYHGFRSPENGLLPYVDPALLQTMRDKGYW
jgi:arylsulfatase A-like enzyme